MQALLQGGNERVAPGFDFVFHGKDVLPLAALLGFGLADVLLEALGVYTSKAFSLIAWRWARSSPNRSEYSRATSENM